MRISWNMTMGWGGGPLFADNCYQLKTALQAATVAQGLAKDERIGSLLFTPQKPETLPVPPHLFFEKTTPLSNRQGPPALLFAPTSPFSPLRASPGEIMGDNQPPQNNATVVQKIIRLLSEIQITAAFKEAEKLRGNVPAIRELILDFYQNDLLFCYSAELYCVLRLLESVPPEERRALAPWNQWLQEEESSRFRTDPTQRQLLKLKDLLSGKFSDPERYPTTAEDYLDEVKSWGMPIELAVDPLWNMGLRTFLTFMIQLAANREDFIICIRQIVQRGQTEAFAELFRSLPKTKKRKFLDACSKLNSGAFEFIKNGEAFLVLMWNLLECFPTEAPVKKRIITALENLIMDEDVSAAFFLQAKPLRNRWTLAILDYTFSRQYWNWMTDPLKRLLSFYLPNPAKDSAPEMAEKLRFLRKVGLLRQPEWDLSEQGGCVLIEIYIQLRQLLESGELFSGKVLDEFLKYTELFNEDFEREFAEFYNKEPVKLTHLLMPHILLQQLRSESPEALRKRFNAKKLKIIVSAAREMVEAISTDDIRHLLALSLPEYLCDSLLKGLENDRLRSQRDFLRGILAGTLLWLDMKGQKRLVLESLIRSFPLPANGSREEWKQMADLFNRMVGLGDLAAQTLATMKKEDSWKQLEHRLNENILNKAGVLLSLDKEQVAALRKSIRERAAFWFQDHFIIHLLSVAGFSSGYGKKAVRELVVELLMPPKKRYQYLYDHFPGDVVEKWMPNRKIHLSTLSKGAGEIDAGQLIQEICRGTRQRILGHLPLGGSQLQGNLGERIFEVFRNIDFGNKKGNHTFRDRLRTLARFLAALEQESDDMAKKGAGRMEKCARILLRYFRENERTLREQGAPGLDGVRQELNQFLREINAIGRQKNKGNLEGYWEITDNPAALLLRGLQPVRTCQRCTEPTSENTSGQLVNPIRFGQFKLVRLHVKIHGSWKVTARLMLEIGGGAENNTYAFQANNQYSSSPADGILIREGVRRYIRMVFGRGPDAIDFADKGSTGAFFEPIELPYGVIIYRD